jgi:hypothetical protein
MVLLQRAGASKLGFLTDPEHSKPPSRPEANGAATGAP